MKPREYCCCAVPIVNAGIYVILVEQFTLGLVVGILSLATPSIVGAATPSFSAWVLAIVCFVGSAVQVLGFIGEKPTLYRRYVSLNALITLSVFAVAAAWIIISASKHSTAKSRCLLNFFPSDDTSQGDTLCEIFPWVDVGIMGGLWVVLGILHIYIFIVLSSYGSAQRRDHDKYDQLNGDNIPMNRRSDPWDSRLSSDSPRSPAPKHDNHGYNHIRQESGASVSDMLSQPQQMPKDIFSQQDYGYQPRSYSHQEYGRATPSYPTNTYTQNPSPTPIYHDTPHNDPISYLNRPPHAQAHPGELSY
ncbi:hypothetical protein BDZ94DRAFT_1222454 [Collybia nuda]|uniref:Transmembrane protein n=1 Tax=Collybia nuda TaxID=64659 RepID=A0A9P5Y039_9AGAR|nr:hypothetical protein BDZ94DRAFT_1222454 [Collybia nuda]